MAEHVGDGDQVGAAAGGQPGTAAVEQQCGGGVGARPVRAFVEPQLQIGAQLGVDGQLAQRAAVAVDSQRPEARLKEEIMMDLSQLPAGLPVPMDDGAADHLVGRPVPHLNLPSTTGESVALYQLGAGRTVLYLYPLTGRPGAGLPDEWDNIPGARGCTAEACDFRDHHDELVDANASRVFGVSSQDRNYQREVVERLRLPFPMLSDTELRLAEQLDLPTFQLGGLKLFKRLTLVICDGVIEHVFYPIFPPNEHARQVLAWLRKPGAGGGTPGSNGVTAGRRRR